MVANYDVRSKLARMLPRVFTLLCFVLLASQTMRTRVAMARGSYAMNVNICTRMDEVTGGIEVFSGVVAFIGPAGAAAGAGMAVAAWGVDIFTRWYEGCG
jgi:hypothetical protein